MRCAVSAMTYGAACMLAALWGGAAVAAEFRSIAPAAAVLYDGPSTRARRLYVAPRGMPIEVISSGDPLWIKGRDVGGDTFWVARSDLTEARTVVAAVPALVRQAASDAAPILFRAERGVLLEPMEPAAGGWVRVRHRDGTIGYVRTNEVWGL